MLRKESSEKTKLFIYAPTLTYSRELSVTTEKDKMLDKTGGRKFPQQPGSAFYPQENMKYTRTLTLDRSLRMRSGLSWMPPGTRLFLTLGKQEAKKRS